MLELLTPDEMKAIDQQTVASGTPLARLMDEAGFAVANLVAARHAFGVRIAVLAGPGDNGGDACVAAKVLIERGYQVSLTTVGVPRAQSEAEAALAAYRGPRPDRHAADIARADIVIDGLFGGGLSRPLDGEAATLVSDVAAAKAAGATVYAIDLPSGVNGATGAITGPAIVADVTITFCRRRIGHVLMPGRAHAGLVQVANIGIKHATVDAFAGPTFLNEPGLWGPQVPRRTLSAHKYSAGHGVVVSGPTAATGAARLAATSALRAGAGLVTLASSPQALLANACHLTTVMLTSICGPDDLAAFMADERHNALCIGPGLPPDEDTRALLRAAFSSSARLVVDAGALTAFAGNCGALANRTNGRELILTPHEGEFARLFPDLEGDKLTRARAAADKVGATLVLKGADTVIAEPGGRAAVNTHAPPALATAGTGDVLAGIITGLLAQSVPTFEAAAMGVWLHGEAAHHAGPAMVADDLVDAIRPARAALLAL